VEFIPNALLTPDEFESRAETAEIGRPQNVSNIATSRVRLIFPNDNTYMIAEKSVVPTLYTATTATTPTFSSGARKISVCICRWRPTSTAFRRGCSCSVYRTLDAVFYHAFLPRQSVFRRALSDVGFAERRNRHKNLFERDSVSDLGSRFSYRISLRSRGRGIRYAVRRGDSPRPRRKNGLPVSQSARRPYLYCRICLRAVRSRWISCRGRRFLTAMIWGFRRKNFPFCGFCL